MAELNGIAPRQIVRELNWSIIIQILTFVFLAGFAYASFESKAEHEKDIADLRKENAILYMPRELSLEKWVNNEKGHELLNKKLDEILREIRSKR